MRNLNPQQFGDFTSVQHNVQKHGLTGGHQREPERDEDDRDVAKSVGKARPFRAEGEPIKYAPHAGYAGGLGPRTKPHLADHVDYSLN